MSEFITRSVNNLVNYYKKTETYSMEQVNNLIAGFTFGGFISVSVLPTVAINTRAIYLVPSTNPTVSNVKDEYINLTGSSEGWELIGSTSLDLTGYVTTEEMNAALAHKVNKIAGKGLSTEDFTTEEKNKLYNLNNYDDTEVRSQIANKADKTEIPDVSAFITNTVDNLLNYYTKTNVNDIVSAIRFGGYKIVDELPDTDIDVRAIYLVPKNVPDTSNIKEEYINLNGTPSGWERIGDTSVDIEGYVTTDEMNAALVAKVDKITGKGLSTNDYTNSEKEKLASLYNYDDTSVRNLISTKVDKIEGKGLSANDFTNSEKSKLEALHNYNDSELRAEVATKADKTEIPDVSEFITKSVSDLVNYYKKTETYSAEQINQLIAAAAFGGFAVVSTLPTTGIDTRTIYLIPSADPTAGNVKDEYINIDGTIEGWEKIGSTSIDVSGYVTDVELQEALSSYYTKSEVNQLISNKQDRLTFDTTPTEGSTNVATSGGIFTALQRKQNQLTFDDMPLEGSTNPVTSGGAFDALSVKQNKLIFDTTPTEGSTNPVTSGGVFDAFSVKQDKLTFDTTPTSGSMNPVTSSGIYEAIQGLSTYTYNDGLVYHKRVGTMPIYDEWYGRAIDCPVMEGLTIAQNNNATANYYDYTYTAVDGVAYNGRLWEIAVPYKSYIGANSSRKYLLDYNTIVTFNCGTSNAYLFNTAYRILGTDITHRTNGSFLSFFTDAKQAFKDYVLKLLLEPANTVMGIGTSTKEYLGLFDLANEGDNTQRYKLLILTSNTSTSLGSPIRVHSSTKYKYVDVSRLQDGADNMPLVVM
ncbi:MAG: hypothetical protein II699_05200 [Lachnospiraceae bacterium]|nr:hypothetical protein [Lachnospiraceae bacterium]